MHRYIVPAVAGLALVGATAIPASTPVDAQETLRWGTSAVGSSGHRALVALATVLNNAQDDYEITVMPTPGAAATLRGYAAGEFEGYYGANVAFHEINDDGGQFQGFKDQLEAPFVQSLWTFTLEMGLGVRAADADQYSGWRDLAGSQVFTGPAPWDTRAALERSMGILGVGHEYIELDTGLAGSSLQDGTIDAFSVYTTGGSSPAPWVTEAMLTTDVHVLSPSEEELAELEAAGVVVVDVSADAFETDIGGDAAKMAPFFYGFHVGMNVPEEGVYNMLVAVEENLDNLVAADGGYGQLAEDMVGLQVRGIESTGDAATIHPGLARWLEEKGAWNEEWNDRIAE